MVLSVTVVEHDAWRDPLLLADRCVQIRPHRIVLTVPVGLNAATVEHMPQVGSEYVLVLTGTVVIYTLVVVTADLMRQ